MEATQQAPFENSFFKPAVNNKPFLKGAFQGLAGSGKTFTAALTAIGLHKKIKSSKPIVMFDTEKSSKFLIPLFKTAGVELLVKESRSLADLKTAMKMCREGYSDILLIDSISHVWEDMLEGYKKKMNRNKLQFQDWGIIKPTWKTEFSNPLVNDQYHVLFCGRAGYEYENELDEDGKRQIYKSGIKMKVEGETAYEPDFLVLMERFEEVLGKDKKVWREATVLKDRSDLLDGQTFQNPTFENFEPIVDAMLNNVVKPEYNEETPVEGLFKTEEDKRVYINKKKIVLEKIEAEFGKYCPGQSTDAKTKKITLAEKVFNTPSWVEIENMSLSVLEDGLEKLKKAIEEDKVEEDLKINGTDKPIKKVKAVAKK